MNTWTEIDQPVLEWVRSLGSTFIPQPVIYQLGLRSDVEDPSEEIPTLSSEQVDEALGRLQGYGLIDGRRDEAIGFAAWARLRLTGRGRQILGDWPELDRLASAGGLQVLLDALADEAEEAGEKAALRRAVGFVGGLGDELVSKTLNDVASSEGKSLGDG